jgi:hypothetical protein
MDTNVILDKSMVEKIVAATGAILVMQWTYRETRTHEWNPLKAEPWEQSHERNYHLIVAVPTSNECIERELQNTIVRLQPVGVQFIVQIWRQETIHRALKTGRNYFALAYRLGYPLYNGAPDLFPHPGAVCPHPT